MKKLIKAVFTFILPLLAIIILLSANIILGLFALLIYLAVFFFTRRKRFYSAMANAFYSRGNYDKAIKWFGKSYNTGKFTIISACNYSYVLLKTGRLDESEKVITSNLSRKMDVESLNQLKSIYALVQWKKGNIEDAINILKEAMKTYTTTSTYGSLGCFLNLSGDYQKALEFNLEAYNYNSSDKIIQDNLGQTYLHLDELDKAKEIYEHLISLSPTFPEAYYNYGLLLEKLNEKERAAEMYKKALEQKFSFLSTLTREEIEAKLS